MAPTAEASPTETPVSPSSPTATPVPVVFYQDNFNDPNSGWGERLSQNYERGYIGGEYRILIKETGKYNWRTATPPFSDFDVRVKARLEGAALGKSYGLIFRQDGKNFYVFWINPTSGKYSLQKRESDEWTTIIGWTPSPHINLGTTPNVLRVIAQGSSFEL